MKALLLTLLTVPAFAQTVHYPLPTVLEDCDDILAPCDSLGLALCLYPVNPGFGMAGVALIPSGGVCSEDGAVLSNGATLTAMVVPFGAQTIEYILVDGEGDFQWETNQGGSPPFVITEPLIVTVMGTGQARITSIRIVGGVVMGLAPQSAQYVNYPPKPRVYYDSDGRLHPYRLKRRR